MKYTKQPRSIEQQIEKLKERGLIIDDAHSAKNYLSNISYYRLRAYTFPFQNNINEKKDHHFLRNDIHFSDIIDLYCFDRRLRMLIFNAIEKIEVAIRTKIIYEYAMATGDSHWFLDKKMYHDNAYISKIIETIENEIKRSKEDFIEHYQKKYDSPILPPAWMTIEVLSFGTLSKIYASLGNTPNIRKKIANSFGLPNAFILENWLFAFSGLRNSCAHHSRIWNRRFPAKLKLPYNTENPFIDRAILKTIKNNKLFAVISCVKYMLDIISPGSDFKKNLIEIISEGGKLLTLKDMGFPQNWLTFAIWQDK